ncbi:MAG: hypothetical protein BHV99_03000 [Clostridium sp. 26_21]|nr:MAG: hypothetical protein BHV99_03000 [Clostridium sp. 26_21]
MNISMLKYIIIGSCVLLAVAIVAYIILSKKMGKSEYAKIKKLQQGTKSSEFSLDVLYQKLYITFIKIPFIKRYLYKLRRRLEILNIDDEYATRRDSARILFNAILILIPIVFATVMITKNNVLLMSILLIFELFIVDSMIDGMVDKVDNKLLKEQIDFFAEIRHAYHEFNMVEEAIYQVSLDDEKSVSRQGEKIYEILISDDPETELEKYYDIAPNSYLKEFAGISYLTKEFGDRKDKDGSSLFLKNVDNITQEMQIEILKRDKLNYVFQSLSIISILPVLLLEPLKNWCVSNFSFTGEFYNGKLGLFAQVIIVLITVVSYVLTRKLKDNGGVQADISQREHPWQDKVYNIPVLKKVIDAFIPKKGTKDYRKMQQLLKDSASKAKMEWVYVNRITLAIVTFVTAIIFTAQLHRIAINYVYTEPTTRTTVLGTLSEKDQKKAKELTEQDNFFINKFRGKLNTTEEEIQKAMIKSKYYTEKDENLATDSKRILKKLNVVNSENMKWFEELIAIAVAVMAYNAPIWLMIFQKKMRQLEMENEVMQFQTIILMLMKIERISVEMILEWLERYSNIFKEPISKCVNNYEAGAWEALEELKQSVSNHDMVRIVESLQSAVEKIPIREAFDELDADKDYHREKRKATNEQFISKKGIIGKVVGFAPMICLFVGYLIIPLVFIGMTSMSGAFSGLQ